MTTPFNPTLAGQLLNKRIDDHNAYGALLHLTGEGRDSYGIWRHRFRQTGRAGIVAFGQELHRIATGKDASQALLGVDDENRAGPTLPHQPAGMLNRLVETKHQRLLVFDNIRELSIGHDRGRLAGAFR